MTAPRRGRFRNELPTRAGVYHLTHSHGPSFPSDRAGGAFGIAWGIYFIDKRAGRVFLAVATLIAFGRLLARRIIQSLPGAALLVPAGTAFAVSLRV